MNETKAKNRKVLLWILIIVVIILAAVAVYLFIKNSKVPIGDLEISKNEEELTLAPGEYDLEALLEALPKLNKLTKLSLPDTTLTAKEIQQVRDVAEGVDVKYTVKLNGQECDETTQKLELGGMKSEQVEPLIKKLDLVPAVNELDIMTPGGTATLTLRDVKTLTEALPNAKLDYEFDLFGQHFTLEDERMVYDTVDIGNEGAEDIRIALSLMPKCKYVLLDDCGIDNEVMESFQKDFPDINFVWRVFIDGGLPFDFLTDEEVLRLTYGLNDENTDVLKYCTNVVYLDLGHNDYLSDISFVEYMPRLECCILSLDPVTDLTPLKSCQNLTWLELIDDLQLRDISPLSEIPSIRYLNISRTSVSDISATDNLPLLERFSAAKLNISPEAQAHFAELHPNCITIYSPTANPFGYGWRDNYYGDFFEYYLHMRQVFHYDGNEMYGSSKNVACTPIYLRDYDGYPWYEWQTVVPAP